MFDRVGVEIELMAPRGSDRRAAARAIADAHGGSIRRFWQPDAEKSAVEGLSHFRTLSLGFAAVGEGGLDLVRCVDDITLRDDLRSGVPARPGWFRLLTDDARLRALLARGCSADAEIEEVFDPVRELFGGRVAVDAGIHRLSDEAGRSIALAAPLVGERERPCELVTPVLTGPPEDLERSLEALLAPVRALGFFAPVEGAVHLHFDAAPLRSAPVLQALIRRLHGDRERLRGEFRTNPRCRRLGPWSPALLEVALAPEFAQLPWEQARTALRETKPSKYCDMNLRGVLELPGAPPTFEVRILPPTLDPAQITTAFVRLAALLREVVEQWAATRETG